LDRGWGQPRGSVQLQKSGEITLRGRADNYFRKLKSPDWRASHPKKEKTAESQIVGSPAGLGRDLLLCQDIALFLAGHKRLCRCEDQSQYRWGRKSYRLTAKGILESGDAHKSCKGTRMWGGGGGGGGGGGSGKTTEESHASST